MRSEAVFKLLNHLFAEYFISTQFVTHHRSKSHFFLYSLDFKLQLCRMTSTSTSSTYCNKSFIGGAFFGAGLTLAAVGGAVWFIGRKLMCDNRTHKRGCTPHQAVAPSAIPSIHLTLPACHCAKCENKDTIPSIATPSMPIAPTPATSSSKQEFKDVPPAILINPAPAVAFDRLSLFQPNPLDID